MPLEVQHELLRFSRLDTQQLLADPSQQLAYGYVAGNALAWNDQMGLGLFKKRTAEEKAQRKRNRQYSKAMKKTQRAYKKNIRKEKKLAKKREKNRPLTDGEIEMLQETYGDSLDYSSISINRGQGILGLFPGDGKVIGNTIYLKKSTYSGDFSAEVPRLKGFITHETGHVWQHQTNEKYHPLKTIPEQFVKDTYSPTPGRASITDYKWEQQAEIFRQYYFKKQSGNPNPWKDLVEEAVK